MAGAIGDGSLQTQVPAMEETMIAYVQHTHSMVTKTNE